MKSFLLSLIWIFYWYFIDF